MVKRILVYGISPGIGGVSEYMMNLFRYVDRNMIQFDFIITGDKCFYEEEINKLGGKVFYITAKKDNFLKNIKELKTILEICKEDHRVFYFNTSGIYYNIPFILAKLKKYVVITHAHNTKSTEIKKILNLLHYLNRIIVRNTSNYCFSCSELAGKWVFGDKFYSKKNNVKIINNSIDCEKFKYNLKKRILMRKKLGFSEGQFVLGTVGRLDCQKNQTFLLDIFYEILKIKYQSKLLLIGDGELREELMSKCKKLGIENNIKFLGARTDISELMQAMDIFLLPSLFEGFPITLVEAQAAGLKCLVSETITKTVNITKNVEFYGLKYSSKEWAEKVLSLRCEKLDTYDILCKKGFNIKTQAKKMELFLSSIK